MQKNGTDHVDFPILKIPEWYFLQCTGGQASLAERNAALGYSERRRVTGCSER
jgi:hypothetical protein